MNEITFITIGLTFIAYYSNKGIIHLASALMFFYTAIINYTDSKIIFMACLTMFFAGIFNAFFKNNQ